MTDFQTVVLFSGSREISPVMQRYAQNMVQKAIDKEYFIFVGDNPRGIDWEVIQYLEAQEYPYVAIWSPYPGEARCISKLRKVPIKVKYGKDAYTLRDRAMAEFSQKGIFLWNGQSPGTKLLYDYMTKNLEKETHLINFRTGKPEVTSFIP